MTTAPLLEPALLDTIITNDRLCIHFQPIVSIRRGAVMIAEALARGIHPETGATIPPKVLFDTASATGKTVALDRACRKGALAAFASLRQYAKELILAINFESSILDQNVLGSNHLLDSVRAAGLQPNQIVLEIVESAVSNIDDLRRFTERYRAEGFLIALDDFGAGHSNFDRIPLLKPDIIKIDRCLIDGMSGEYHKREIVRSLVLMAHQIGAITIAEGVEYTEDLLAAQKSGIDMYQGFVFGKPGPANSGVLACPHAIITDAASSLRESQSRDMELRRELCAEFCAIQDEFVKQLAASIPAEFDRLLNQFIEDELALEAIYIASFEGVLVTNTHVQSNVLGHQRSRLVTPAPVGTDLSQKPYCSGIQAGMDRFISEPYISQATGDICITLSRPFTCKDGAMHILCCDIAFSGADEI